DGLLNLNAHGFYSHFEGFIFGNDSSAEAPFQQFQAEFSPAWTTGTNPPQPAPMMLPHGSGYGPADISLLKVFAPPATDARSIRRNRYAAAGEGTARPGHGLTGVNDPLSRMATIGIPNNYVANSASFGSPPDRLGHGFTYLDYA